MWSDGLTREKDLEDIMKNILIGGKCDFVDEEINRVVCIGQDIKMRNI